MTGSYFERIDETVFRPTDATGGGWNPDELHVSPIMGLLVHAISRYEGGASGLQLSRVGFDILGALPFDDYTIDTVTRRAGRTIELIEATATAAGRPVVSARAWRLVASETSEIASDRPHPMPPPDSMPSWPISERWPGSFAASLEVRALDGDDPGHMRAWVRTPLELVAGEREPLSGFFAMIDVVNGIAPHRTPDVWFYPNVDLTAHLHREPAGDWVGFDSTVTFGRTGLGLTNSVLHDEQGPVGVVSQSLTVRRRP